MGKELKPSERNPDDLPDERAFQDEFTRAFLQSIDETRPGYYPFLSNTGRYKMDFPAGGDIIKRAYSINNDSYEFINANYFFNDDTIAFFQLKFFSENDTEKLAFHLDILQGRLSKKLNFEIHNYSDIEIYYDSFQRNDFDYHVAYIQNISKSSTGGIEFVYSIDCKENSCTGENSLSKQHFLEWVQTIEFINANEGGK